MDFVARVRRGYGHDLVRARTSMEILVEAYAEEPRTGNRELVCEAYFSFVAVDENSRPIPIPPVELETERDRKLNAAANERYNARKSQRRAGKSD